jgi:hypothetical protein
VSVPFWFDPRDVKMSSVLFDAASALSEPPLLLSALKASPPPTRASIATIKPVAMTSFFMPALLFLLLNLVFVINASPGSLNKG